MAKDLKIVRFFTGEDVIGEVLEVTEKTTKIRNPVRIVVIPSKENPKEPGVALAPFTNWSKDKEFVIYNHVIMCQMEPITDFINQYNSIFGGIVMADNKLILPGQ